MVPVVELLEQGPPLNLDSKALYKGKAGSCYLIGRSLIALTASHYPANPTKIYSLPYGHDTADSFQRRHHQPFQTVLNKDARRALSPTQALQFFLSGRTDPSQPPHELPLLLLPPYSITA